MSRSLEHSIALKAPASLVWKALTEAEGLKSWFSLDAKVVPGVGGSIWSSFGPGSEWSVPIVVWEPNKHLRTEMECEPGSVPFAVDYFLEARGETTVLRIVTSGFGDEVGWNEMYDGMDAGWSYFLLNIQVALVRHRGVPRALAYQRRRVAGTRAEGWERLQQTLGLSSISKAGDTISVELAGEAVTGTLILLKPSRCLAISLPSLNDGLLMLEQEPGDPEWTLGGYLSMYGVPAATVAKLQASFSQALDHVAGPAVDS